MKFIMLTATMPSRRDNLPFLRENYLQAMSRVQGMADFEWHLAYWPEEFEEMGNLEKVIAPVPFRVFSVPKSDQSIHPAFTKMNSVLDIVCAEGFHDPDTFIATMADDDMISINLLRNLHEAYSRSRKPLLISSAARGQEIGKSGHGAWNLLAAPEAMKQCYITGEQHWMHADLFTGKLEKPRRFPEDDGLFIERLYVEHPEWFEFLPDSWMLFNVLEPGRWTDTAELKRYLNL